MKILGIDSSGLVASVAVTEDDNLLGEFTMNYKKTHSQTLLPMLDELAKMRRIITRDYPEANVEALIVLDGTTGQNALEQARQFSNVTELDGIVITKLDGTAKGGIAIAIQAELDVPVKFIGVGEKIGDLQRFDPQEYVNALFADFDEDRSEIDMLIGDDM